MMRSLFEKEEKGELLNKLKIDLISRYYPLSEDEILRYERILNFDRNHLMKNLKIFWTISLIYKLKDKIDWTIVPDITLFKLSISFFEKFEKYIDFKTIGYSNNIKWSKTLIDYYGNRFDWSKHLILKEPLSTVDNLRKYKEILDWSIVSKGIKLSFSDEILEEFKDCWNWKGLSSNPSLPISMEFITKYIEKLDLNELSKNPTSLPLIYKHPTLSYWNWESVIINRGLIYTQEIFDFIFPLYNKHHESKGQNDQTKTLSFLIWSNFYSSQSDLSFFLSEKYIRFISWDLLSKSNKTKLSLDFINTYKRKLNFKESGFIYRIKDIITTDFIIKNKELFDPKNIWFYHLPLTIDLIQTHFKDIDYSRLSLCEKLDWNWDFIEEHLYEFNMFFLSINKGIYSRLIEKSLSKDEVFSIMGKTDKTISPFTETTNLKTISHKEYYPFIDDNDNEKDDMIWMIKDSLDQQNIDRDMYYDSYLDQPDDESWMYDTNV